MFSISCPGIANLATANFPADFKFILGEAQYACSKVCAAFLSPKISRLLASNPSIAGYEFGFLDRKGQFPQILSLLQGSTLKIDGSNYMFVMAVAKELENKQMLEAAMACPMATEHLTVGNAALQLVSKSDLNIDYRSEYKFVTANFSDINMEDLAQARIDVLQKILNSKHLICDTESTILNFIKTAIKANPEAAILIKYLKFEFLTPSDLQILNQLITPADITREVLDAMMKRMMLPVSPGVPYPRGSDKNVNSSSELVLEKKIPFNGENFNGVIKFMQTNNIAFQIRASSTISGFPKDLIQQTGEDKNWISQSVENSFIQLDFKTRAIHLSGYTLKSGSDWYPRSWKVEGSLNGSEWTVIDRRDSNNILCRPFASYMLRAEPTAAGVPFRFIKITQTDRNSSGTFGFQLGGIELFGSILAPQ